MSIDLGIWLVNRKDGDFEYDETEAAVIVADDYRTAVDFCSKRFNMPDPVARCVGTAKPGSRCYEIILNHIHYG